MFLLFVPFWLRNKYNMTKRLPISRNDFELFDAELNSYEYEYFCRHIGAFKRFMQEEPKEQRQLFLDAFCEYSYNNPDEVKAIASMSDPGKKFIESFQSYAQETFINGKFSTAKQFLNDSVIVARNKHMIPFMDSHSYAKDPFFHKETRDVFRRLFGEPTEAGTRVKVVYVLPLYVRFAGSVCRYLRKWLDMEESLYPMPIKNGKSKKDKKAMKEKANATARARTQQAKTAAIVSQRIKPAIEKTNGDTIDEQNTAVVSKNAEDLTPADDDDEDFSSFYCDMHERKKRKREVQKKGKKHEIACQHPCHGKVCQCNDRNGHSHAAGHSHVGHSHVGGHHGHTITPADPSNCQHPCHGKICHCHDGKEHDHARSVDPATQQQLMSCLCTKHKALAEAKVAEKRAALEKHQAESSAIKSLKDKNSDKKNSDKTSVAENSEKTSEVKNSDKTSEVENSEKIVDENNIQGKASDVESTVIISEVENCEGVDKMTDDKATRDKTSDNKTSGDKVFEEEKPSEVKTCEGENAQVKFPEDHHIETKDFEGQTAHENGTEGQPIDSSDDSSDSAVERFVRKMFPELHLGEPHPNQQYAEMMTQKLIEEEEAKMAARERTRKTKLRTCAFCRTQETEPKTFKKCQKCKGKGTKFYCSRDCQKLDWTKHRLVHLDLDH